MMSKERDKLHSVILGQGFHYSGQAGGATAVQLGRLLGARYIMTGYGAETRDCDGYGMRTRRTFFRLKLST